MPDLRNNDRVLLSARAQIVHRLLRYGPRTKRAMFRATGPGITPEDILQGLHQLLRDGIAEITPDGRYALTASTSSEPAANPG